MKKRILSMNDIREIKADAQWALSNQGKGWVSASDTLALVETIETMRESALAVYEAMIRD